MVIFGHQNCRRSRVERSFFGTLSNFQLQLLTISRSRHGATCIHFPVQFDRSKAVNSRKIVDRRLRNYWGVRLIRERQAGINGGDVDGVVVLAFAKFADVIAPVGGVWLFSPVIVEGIVSNDFGFETSEFVGR